MRSDECVCAWSRSSMFCAVGCSRILFEAIVVFSEALEVICELYMALDAVLEVAAAGVAANVVSDMAAERRCSGCKDWGWGACRGPIGRPCRVWRHFCGVWGQFEVGEAVFVAVADGDVAVASSGLGCRGRGRECCWGAVV